MLPTIETDCPELRLWRSALASYLKDVIHWHGHRKPFDGDSNRFTAGAYADFYGNNYQFTRLCEFAGYDPEYLKRKLIIFLLKSSKLDS